LQLLSSRRGIGLTTRLFATKTSGSLAQRALGMMREK